MSAVGGGGPGGSELTRGWVGLSEVIQGGDGRTRKKIQTKQNQKNSHATFVRILPNVPGFVRIATRFAQIPGRSAKFAKKWQKNNDTCAWTPNSS